MPALEDMQAPTARGVIMVISATPWKLGIIASLATATAMPTSTHRTGATTARANVSIAWETLLDGSAMPA